jgi:hypothetical protein
MSLMPDAGYAEVMAALASDLVLVPWQRPYEVPTGKVLSAWRATLGPAALTELRRRALAGVDAEHRDTTCPQIFTVGRLWVMDRNFPGADRVSSRTCRLTSQSGARSTC